MIYFSNYISLIQRIKIEIALLIPFCFLSLNTLAASPDGTDLYLEGKYKSAIQLWQIDAEKEDPRSIFLLGMMHLEGSGVPVSEVKALEGLRDRFGRVPDPVKNLVRTFRLKAALSDLGVHRVTLRDDFYLIEYVDRLQLESWLAPHEVDLRPIRTGLANLHIPAKHSKPAQAVMWLDAMLSTVSL